MRKTNIIILAIALLICFQSHAQIWRQLGSGITGNYPVVYSIQAYNNKIYAGGFFLGAGNVSSKSIAVWDGVKWDSLGLGLYYGGDDVYDMEVLNNELYVGGRFECSSGLPWPNHLIPNTSNIAKWNGTNWSAVHNSTPGDNAPVYSVFTLQEFNNQLYVGGDFIQAGSTNLNRITKLDSTGWNTVGMGVTGGFGRVDCIVKMNGSIYALGDFSHAGGNLSKNIARWDGTTWSSLDIGLSNFGTTMVADTANNIIYATGAFTYAGSNNLLVNGIAGWNGTNWFALDTTVCGGIMSMCIYHNKLFIGGGFRIKNCNPSDSVFYLAYWNGLNFTPIIAPNNLVSSMKVIDDTLYIGGYFDTINNLAFSHIAAYYDTSTALTITEVPNQSFTITPNPASTQITVKLTSQNQFIQKAEVTNRSGQLLFSQPQTTKTNSIQIPIATLPKGTYYITVFSNGKKVSKQFLKN